MFTLNMHFMISVREKVSGVWFFLGGYGTLPQFLLNLPHDLLSFGESLSGSPHARLVRNYLLILGSIVLWGYLSPALHRHRSSAVLALCRGICLSVSL